MTTAPSENSVSPRGRIFGRPLRSVLSGLFNPLHYLSIFRSGVYENVWDSFLKRYILSAGYYPNRCLLRAPCGVVAADTYSHYDMLTINEIFIWQCYGDKRSAKTVVDFGGNIGISALYFLARNPQSYVYVYEPLASNCEKLVRNLSAFSDRYKLIEAAVSTHNGRVDFSVEPTGRYCGIGLNHEALESVACVEANQALEDVVSERGQIDVLKVDIEGAEWDVFQQIDSEILEAVETIYVESDDFDVSLLTSKGYSHERHLSGVHHFSKRVS